MAKRKGTSDSDVETLEAPPEGIPDTTGRGSRDQARRHARHPRAAGDEDAAAPEDRQGLEVENATGLKKQDLIFKILKERVKQNGLMFGEGTLEVLPDGFGFLRAPTTTTSPAPTTSTSRPSQIRRFGLQDRRHRRRPDPPAQGERALLRPAPGRGDQLRGPRLAQREGRLRRPDAAPPARPASAGDAPTSITCGSSTWSRRSARASAA